MRPVRIGDTVLWFPHADKNKIPSVAIIVAVSGKERAYPALSLQILPPVGVGGITTAFCGVRRIDDPYHDDHPDPKIRLGGWETIDGNEKRLAAEKRAVEEAKERAVEAAAAKKKEPVEA